MAVCVPYISVLNGSNTNVLKDCFLPCTFHVTERGAACASSPLLLIAAFTAALPFDSSISVSGNGEVCSSSGTMTGGSII